MTSSKTTPLPSRFAVHLAPCPGERKGAAAMSTPFQLGFLFPGQGEMWTATQEGVGVRSPWSVGAGTGT